MAYNPQTDCNHYHVYHAHTVLEGRNEYYFEVSSSKKVAVICIPDYGITGEVTLIRKALERQGIYDDFKEIEDGYLLNQDGHAVFYIEL